VNTDSGRYTGHEELRREAERVRERERRREERMRAKHLSYGERKYARYRDD